MEIIVNHNQYYKDHLKQVITEMQTLGAPTIKAVYDECDDVYIALEGRHRIEAAKRLGLTPIIDEIDNTDDILMRDITDMDTDYTVAEHVNNSMQNQIIEI